MMSERFETRPSFAPKMAARIAPDLPPLARCSPVVGPA